MKLIEYRVMVKGNSRYLLHSRLYSKEQAEELKAKLIKEYGHTVRIDTKQVDL